MKRIGILGDIGSGKTYVAKCFGFPVFIADLEVAKIYKNNKKVFFKARIIEETTPPAPKIKTLFPFKLKFNFFIAASKPAISVLCPTSSPFS